MARHWRAGRLETAVAGWLLLCLLLAYVPDIGQGFISDDFGWIAHSEIRSGDQLWRMFVDTPMGFYRPVVSLSFVADRALFDLAPIGYAVTNLALVCGIAAGIVALACAHGYTRLEGLFAAAVWTFNLHGVGMALTWISGRTSLLATLFAVLAALAVSRGRPVRGGLLTLAALLSKEEAVLLPVILAAWVGFDHWWDGAAPAPALAATLRKTWPAFGALALYLLLRQQSTAFTPWNAPAFYALSISPRVIGPNLLEYADRALTFAAAVLLIGILFAGRLPAIASAERRVIAKGAVWLVLGFAITILVPVRSDLYACFPSVGVSLIAAALGRAIWAAIPVSRRRAATLVALLLPLVLVPVYRGRNVFARNDARLSTRIVNHVSAALAGREDLTRVDVYQDGSEKPSITSALGGALSAAIHLHTGREVVAELHRTAPDMPWPPPEPGSLRVKVVQGDIVSASEAH